MDPSMSEYVKESLQQAIKEAIAAEESQSKPSPRGEPTSAEVVRLLNALKAKEKELDETRKEVTALKSTLNTKDRALNQTEHEFRLLKERNITTEGELANMAKELAALKVEKRKTQAHLSNIMKLGDKEQARTALVATVGGSEGGVPNAEQAAALQTDLRSAKMDSEKASEGVRALDNLFRAKDRHIAGLQRKAEEADLYRAKCSDLENRVLDLNRQIDEMRAAARQAGELQRASDAETARLTADLAKAKAALAAAAEAAARSSATLKATEVRCVALEQEVGTLVTQLARTSVVAQRVAAAEVKAGCKDEGVVHVTRHLEEIRFMSGEIVRLQQRVTSLEKELAVSHELKEHYRSQSQPGGSSNGSASSPCGTPTERPASRAGSRPFSTPRRPSSASPRAYTAPHVRSALRASAAAALGGGVAAETEAPAATTASTSSPGAATLADSPSSAVRSSVGTAARRLSKPQPWNTPAKTPVAGAAVGGAGVLARSGAKVGPSVRSPPGPGAAATRPRSMGSAGGSSIKGVAGLRKSPAGSAQARGATAGRSPAAGAGATAAASVVEGEAAVAVDVSVQAGVSHVAQAPVAAAAGAEETATGATGGVVSYPIVADGEGGGEAAAAAAGGEAAAEAAAGEPQEA